jgi:hypothetical protein|tara:strand:- start:937 stop:1191 length:255 start_codon:yes stop_codon:yes gene_type:complete
VDSLQNNVTDMKEFRHKMREKNLVRYRVKVYSKGTSGQVPGVLLEQLEKNKSVKMWLDASEIEDVVHILMESHQTLREHQKPNP